MTHPFRVAPQSYFRITNLDEAWRDFCTSDISEPRFTHDRIADTELQYRQAQVDSMREKNMLELVVVSNRLAKKVDQETVEQWRTLNQELYGELSPAYAEFFLQKLLAAADHVTNKAQVDYITERIPGREAVDETNVASRELFDKLRGYLMRYIDPEVLQLDRTLKAMIDNALTTTGLSERGWTVEVVPGSAGARTIHKQKKIRIGESYEHRSNEGKLRVAIHEVYGHALRGPSHDSRESEGFAGLLEQLLSSRYATFRGYRYLAACLGWGVFERPMSFRQTYEILWRAMMLGGRYDKTTAKRYAFLECVRIFRGGIVDDAGAVFLKDAQYFSGNIHTWMALEALDPTYEEFCEILEGKRRLVI